MTDDGRIDEAALERHVAAVAETPGIRGLLVNGHAGENFVLTAAEKRRVVEISRAAAPTSCLICSGVNAESSLEAAREAEAAEAAGADVLLVFPPNSWALDHDEACVDIHHAHVRDATSLPLLLYGAPIGAGRMAYSAATLARLAAEPRIVGVKEGSWEVAAYEANRRLLKGLRPDFVVLGSGDEHLLASYLVGSEGSQVSLAAVAPELAGRALRPRRSRGLGGRAKGPRAGLPPGGGHLSRPAGRAGDSPPQGLSPDAWPPSERGRAPASAAGVGGGKAGSDASDRGRRARRVESLDGVDGCFGDVPCLISISPSAAAPSSPRPTRCAPMSACGTGASSPWPRRRGGGARDRRLRPSRHAGRHRQPRPSRAAVRPRHRHGGRFRLRHRGGRRRRQHLRDAVRPAAARQASLRRASRTTAGRPRASATSTWLPSHHHRPDAEVLGQELPALVKERLHLVQGLHDL